jgi:hypothetical protein
MGTTFSVIDAVGIHNLQEENVANNKKMATLTHFLQIKEEHLKHFVIKNDFEIQITLNAISYNPAILFLFGLNLGHTFDMRLPRDPQYKF